MNVSFIALNTSGAETVQSAADRIRSSFAELGRCDFRLCSSMAQVSSALSDAFSNSDVVAVGAEPSVYSKAKVAILRAMHVHTKLNEEIKARIGENGSLDAQQLSLHCVMPESADVFLSDDGMFSGFAIKSGKQHFIMLSLDKLRLDVQLECVAAYFGAADKAQPEEPGVQASAVPKSNCAEKAVALLKNCGKKVYFADTPSCEMVKEICGEETVKDVFVFTDYTTQRGAEAPRSYIADLARYSIPDSEDAFGASVSNVYTGNSQDSNERKYNIYVAVADKNASRVLRFASQPGETPDDLISAAIEFLMDMICEKCEEPSAAASAAVVPDKPFSADPVEEIEEPTPQEIKKKKHTGFRTVLYVLLALLLAFVGYFAFNGYKNAEENKANAISSFADYYSQGAAAQSGSLLVFAEDVEDSYGAVPPPQEVTVPEEEMPGAILTTDGTTVRDAEQTSDEDTATVPEAVVTTKPDTTKPVTTKPTTTKKPVTTKPDTTKKPTTTAKQNSSGKVNGRFVFTVYGYGHGVGMSQEGALGYSRAGSSYTNILLHYYPGTTLVKSDLSMPEKVRFGGKEYSVLEYLCRSVIGEIGAGCNSATAEAFKAQTVALYTYAKRYNYNISATMHAFNTVYNYEGTAVETAVKSVMGEYLSYNGRAVEATFYAMSAGKTTLASKVWGSNAYPYLEKSVDSPHDKKCAKYKTEYSISAEEFRDLMKKTIGVELSGDPAGWIKVVRHDSAVNSSVGYVDEVVVGGKSMRGAYFRSTAMEYKIRSHCFSVTYVEG